MRAIILIALALAWAAPAYAQGRPFVPTGNLPKDIAATKTPPGLAAAPGEPALDQLWSKIVGAAVDDLKYAKALSDAVGTTGSLARGECWAALIKANEDAQGKSLKNADGTPMVKPTPHLFTEVEQLGQVIDNLAPTGPVFLGCSKAATMLRMSVLAFINAAVTGAAGITAIAGVT